ncbi:hypothetical protein MKX01_041783 [Papaver californicum]|nr:hypothetical protein MKX01_041783 [Papaver californicum]
MELSAFPSSTSYFSFSSPVIRNTNLHNPNNINLSQFTSTRRREISPISIPRVNVESPLSKKHDLLRAVQDTQRGLITNPDQRSSIEEALLQYTSASDVVVLFESAQRFPFLQVGQIFQKFECRDQTDGGVVRNVVRWSIPSLLEISVQNIKISKELQAWIAAVLHRSYLSLKILQFHQTFKAAVPVTIPGRRSTGGLYYLSYLDNNMLLGRAVGGGGVFVFTKAQPFLL